MATSLQMNRKLHQPTRENSENASSEKERLFVVALTPATHFRLKKLALIHNFKMNALADQLIQQGLQRLLRASA